MGSSMMFGMGQVRQATSPIVERKPHLPLSSSDQLSVQLQMLDAFAWTTQMKVSTVRSTKSPCYLLNIVSAVEATVICSHASHDQVLHCRDVQEGTTNLITRALAAVGRSMETMPDPTQIHYRLPKSAAHPEVCGSETAPCTLITRGRYPERPTHISALTLWIEEAIAVVISVWCSARSSCGT